MEIRYFLQLLCKYGLSKTIALEYNLSSIIRKDDISLKEMKDISQKKYMEILFFKEAPAPS